MKNKKLFIIFWIIILILISFGLWYYFNNSVIFNNKNTYSDIGTFISPDNKHKQGIGFQWEKGKIEIINTQGVKNDCFELAKNKTKVEINGRFEMGPGISCEVMNDCPEQEYFILNKIKIIK